MAKQIGMKPHNELSHHLEKKSQDLSNVEEPHLQITALIAISAVHFVWNGSLSCTIPIRYTTSPVTADSGSSWCGARVGGAKTLKLFHF